MTDLHSALKTHVVGNLTGKDTRYLAVDLQHGKDSRTHSLHAQPHGWSGGGFQTNDFLRLLGFHRSPCAFHAGECYCKEIPPDLDLPALDAAIGKSFDRFKEGVDLLERCGFVVDQPEGLGYFLGRPSQGRFSPRPNLRGNGHVAPKSERMKDAEDAFFTFVLTWIEGGGDKGWVTHYRPKHLPLSDEFHSVFTFLGAFNTFGECPEFDFEACWWRFLPFEVRENSFRDSNAEAAHHEFGAHASNFSPGIQALLDAHALIRPWGMAFLSNSKPAAQSRVFPPRAPSRPSSIVPSRAELPAYEFDVAFSFAGSERDLAEEIAGLVRTAGLRVFYDNFYPDSFGARTCQAFSMVSTESNPAFA